MISNHVKRFKRNDNRMLRARGYQFEKMSCYSFYIELAGPDVAQARYIPTRPV